MGYTTPQAEVPARKHMNGQQVIHQLLEISLLLFKQDFGYKQTGAFHHTVQPQQGLPHYRNMGVTQQPYDVWQYLCIIAFLMELKAFQRLPQAQHIQKFFKDMFLFSEVFIIVQHLMEQQQKVLLEPLQHSKLLQ